MFQLIQNFIDNLTKSDINSFALKNNITLSPKEVDFLFQFIKKNYEALMVNPDVDLSKYKPYFQDGNFEKIMAVIEVYKKKYSMFLR